MSNVVSLIILYVLHLFHLEHSSMLLSQAACSGYKKQTRVIMRIGILTHSFSCLGTDTNATQSVPSPCEWRRARAHYCMSSTETPQCLWHTHARAPQPSEQSPSQCCWMSLIQCQTQRSCLHKHSSAALNTDVKIHRAV